MTDIPEEVVFSSEDTPYQRAEKIWAFMGKEKDAKALLAVALYLYRDVDEEAMFNRWDENSPTFDGMNDILEEKKREIMERVEDRMEFDDDQWGPNRTCGKKKPQ